MGASSSGMKSPRWLSSSSPMGVSRPVSYTHLLDALVLAEEIADLGVLAQTQRAQQHGDGDLAVFIDAHVEHVVGVGLVLKPGAAVGVQGGGEQLFAGLVIACLLYTSRCV